MTRRTALTLLAIVGIMAVVLLWMGRVPICTCGTVKLWHGVVFSSENSQHLSDWYTFTHVIHGFVFYPIIWLIGRRWPLATRLIVATVVEASWEILENTDFIINRYREVTISLDYFGDSVVNSVSDVVAMLLGFIIAAKAPARLTLAVAIGLEFFLAWAIRDNLTINVIMLVYPLDVIRAWQSGG